MKQAYVLFLLALCCVSMNAQTVTIPSPTLRTILLNYDCATFDEAGTVYGDVDTNNDGLIQVSEAEAVLSLSISNVGGSLPFPSIGSLEGLSAFTNLKKLGFLSLDALSSITNDDIPDSLEELYVNAINNFIGEINLNGHSNIQKFITEGVTNMNTVNFSNCTSMEEINIRSDINDINVTGCSSLSLLEVGYNELTTLDLTGCTSLLILGAAGNHFETLDLSMMSGNTTIYVSENPYLKTLNIKNGEADFISVYDTPLLEYVCIDEIDAIYFDYLATSTDLPAFHYNTYCSFTPGGESTAITGNITLDVDSDGCDVDDIAFPNINFQITDGTTTDTFISNSLGSYAIYLPNDTYTITPQLENPDYFNVTPASITVNTLTETSPYTQDFCITPNGVNNDLEITIIPLEIARPGFDVNYKILYKNRGNTTLSGQVGFTFDDTVTDFLMASPVEDNQIGSTLYWNYANLDPFEERTVTVTMNLNSPVEVPALNSGDILDYSAIITPDVSDETPGDNAFELQQEVVNSFDPNDKTCLEGKTITTSYIGDYVHYMIRFENTGTASAVNVVVSDVIDTSLFDMTTFTPITASHNMVTRIQNGNEVEFIFENINLPFDDATNDGYIIFKIKTLPSLVEGDTLENKANIYFDFNAPIVTNTENTLISDAVLSTDTFALDTSQLEVFPNPITDIISISSKQPIETLEIITFEGKKIYQNIVQQNTDYLYQEDLSFLGTGIYFLVVQTQEERIVKKLVKL